jgi:predicted transcriptional regulator
MMKEKYKLSKSETQVMNILWNMSNEEGATSAEVLECYKEPRPALTTVLTFLKRLTEKGFIRTEKQGKILRFTPIVSREDYTAHYMKDAKETFFGGSPISLISFFVQHEQMDDEQIRELFDIIQQKRQL